MGPGPRLLVQYRSTNRFSKKQRPGPFFFSFHSLAFSTTLAALKARRNSIANELDPDYFKLGSDRVKDEAGATCNFLGLHPSSGFKDKSGVLPPLSTSYFPSCFFVLRHNYTAVRTVYCEARPIMSGSPYTKSLYAWSPRLEPTNDLPRLDANEPKRASAIPIGALQPGPFLPLAPRFSGGDESPAPCHRRKKVRLHLTQRSIIVKR